MFLFRTVSGLLVLSGGHARYGPNLRSDAAFAPEVLAAAAAGDAATSGGHIAASESVAAQEGSPARLDAFEVAMQGWLPRFVAAAMSAERRPDPKLLPHDWKTWQKKLESNMAKSVHFEGDTIGCEGQGYDFYKFARKESVKTICETGFNRGFSSLLWLVSNPSAKVYSFDIGKRPVTKSAEFLARSFVDSKGGPRFTLTIGDSETTLLDFRAKNPKVECDLVFVDGGHSERTALADITNFAAMSRVNSTLIVDDVLCPKGSQFCNGPTRAVQAAINNGIVEKVADRMCKNNNTAYAILKYRLR